MPHLKELLTKERLDAGGTAYAASHLNYAITRQIIRYVQDQVDQGGQLTYQIVNDVLGALEGAKGEFQRQIVDPFEATKAAENGNVYPSELTELTWAPEGKPLGSDGAWPPPPNVDAIRPYDEGVTVPLPPSGEIIRDGEPEEQWFKHMEDLQWRKSEESAEPADATEPQSSSVDHAGESVWAALNVASDAIDEAFVSLRHMESQLKSTTPSSSTKQGVAPSVVASDPRT